MSADIGLNMDMNSALQWPGRVRVRIHIDHLRGAAEEWRLSLNRGVRPGAVTVGPDPGPAAGAEGRYLLWQELPGPSLRQRSLAVVAASVFDSVLMAPRISGVPAYRSVALALAAEGHESRATQVQVLAGAHGNSRALLRHRYAQDDPWTEQGLVLLCWDADPLRAVLRLAMSLREPGTRLKERGGLAGPGLEAPLLRPAQAMQVPVAAD